jgi:hypothetical protein
MKTTLRLVSAIVMIACFSLSASAQRQTALYIDNGSGLFTKLTATGGGGTLNLPSSGTLLSSSNGVELTPSSNQTIQGNATGVIPLTIEGFAGQTADLQDWSNSGATVLASVNAAGAGTFTSLSTTTSGAITAAGNLSTGGHVITTSTVSGYGWGGSVTSASVSGSDVAGVITFSTSAVSGGCSLTITFGNTYGTAPVVVISPSNYNAGYAWGASVYYAYEPFVVSNPSGFTVYFYNSTFSLTNASVNYIVVH